MLVLLDSAPAEHKCRRLGIRCCAGIVGAECNGDVVSHVPDDFRLKLVIHPESEGPVSSHLRQNPNAGVVINCESAPRRWRPRLP